MDDEGEVRAADSDAGSYGLLRDSALKDSSFEW